MLLVRLVDIQRQKKPSIFRPSIFQEEKNNVEWISWNFLRIANYAGNFTQMKTLPTRVQRSLGYSSRTYFPLLSKRYMFMSWKLTGIINCQLSNIDLFLLLHSYRWKFRGDFSRYYIKLSLTLILILDPATINSLDRYPVRITSSDVCR